MADKPIDCTDRPSMTSVQCGGNCGQWIVVDKAYTGVGYCTSCALERIDVEHADGTRMAANNYLFNGDPNAPPADPRTINYPPAVYPPSGRASNIRPADPDTAGYCMRHPRPANVGLMSLTPADVAIAYAIHDHIHHRPDAWLIGPAGGADDDICRACAGAKWDRDIGKEVAMEGGPRHDLCLKGRTRGRGANCPCTHDKPHMRGIKPGDPHPADVPGAVARLRAELAAHNPPPPAAPAPPPIAAYLFDPEEYDTDD
jgi:hypothetical protein